jgi:predicted metal-dependent HD superfamily phosphohydrolase
LKHEKFADDFSRNDFCEIEYVFIPEMILMQMRGKIGEKFTKHKNVFYFEKLKS